MVLISAAGVALALSHLVGEKKPDSKMTEEISQKVKAFQYGKEYFKKGVISSWLRDLVGAVDNFEKALKSFEETGMKSQSP